MPPRAITAEEFANWLTPSQAVQILDSAFGNDSHSYTSKHTLLERLIGGMVLAVAERSARRKDHATLTEIPAYDWHHVSTTTVFWTTGDLTYSYGGTFETTTFRHFNVRFQPDQVRAIIANQVPKPPKDYPSSPSPEPVTAATNAGRPRKEWWDDFWIEICRQIYEGELRPKKQSDLERAMHDWAVEHGHDVGETTIKSAARKLFRAWKLPVP